MNTHVASMSPVEGKNQEVLLSNIIAGMERTPQSRKTSGRFSYPVSTAQDVASAVKFARFQKIDSLDKVIRALTKIGREANWISDEDMRVQAELSGSPIKHMRGSIEAVNSWLANIETYVKQHGTLVTIGEDENERQVLIDGNGQLCQGGVSTTFVLAGDEIAIAPWNIAQAMLAGTRAIIKPSRIEPLSAFLFTKALIDEGLTPPSLLYLSRETQVEQDLLQTLLKQTRQSVMYGEDNTVDTICAPFGFRADHKYHAYLTGRSGAIMYDDADVAKAADLIIRGATDDRGNRCNSTKKVFAPVAMQEELEAALVARADRLVRGAPMDPNTDLGKNDPQARVIADQWSAGSKVFYDRDLILMGVEQSAPVLKEELPYPVVAVCYYRPEQDPVDLMNMTVDGTYLNAAIAVSIYTEDKGRFTEASARTQACKTLHNLPSTAYDFWTSHQRWHLFMELTRKVELVAD